MILILVATVHNDLFSISKTLRFKTTFFNFGKVKSLIISCDIEMIDKCIYDR